MSNLSLVNHAALTSALSSFSWSLGMTYLAYSLAARAAPTKGAVHHTQWCSQNLHVHTHQHEHIVLDTPVHTRLHQYRFKAA